MHAIASKLVAMCTYLGHGMPASSAFAARSPNKSCKSWHNDSAAVVQKSEACGFALVGARYLTRHQTTRASDVLFYVWALFPTAGQSCEISVQSAAQIGWWLPSAAVQMFKWPLFPSRDAQAQGLLEQSSVRPYSIAQLAIDKAVSVTC